MTTTQVRNYAGMESLNGRLFPVTCGSIGKQRRAAWPQITPPDRLRESRDFAAFTLSLSSDLASFVSGQTPCPIEQL